VTLSHDDVILALVLTHRDLRRVALTVEDVLRGLAWCELPEAMLQWLWDNSHRPVLEAAAILRLQTRHQPSSNTRH